jgi:hypothetical protein
VKNWFQGLLSHATCTATLRLTHITHTEHGLDVGAKSNVLCLVLWVACTVVGRDTGTYNTIVTHSHNLHSLTLQQASTPLRFIISC